MEPEAKRPVGRPKGRLFSRKLFVYVCDERYERARRLAARRRSSLTQLFRDLIDEAAKREGIE